MNNPQSQLNNLTISDFIVGDPVERIRADGKTGDEGIVTNKDGRYVYVKFYDSEDLREQKMQPYQLRNHRLSRNVDIQ